VSERKGGPVTAQQEKGSTAFVTAAINRDSLTPLPIHREGLSLIHRQVCATLPAAAFSASRGHPVFAVDLPASSVSLSVGVLAAEQATTNHRHAYESLLYILEGEGHSIVEGRRIDWRAGDALYVPPWNWHVHACAAGQSARYLTATNLPLLQHLGQTVLRQEEPRLRVE
jgi:quercetin dioxygenase-like cupin family protein